MANVKQSEPFPIAARLTCARYGKRTMGIGKSGGPAIWFFATKARDLDASDVVVLHRLIELWNAAGRRTVEEIAAKPTAKSVAHEIVNKLNARLTER